jgi:hypothetical protein
MSAVIHVVIFLVVVKAMKEMAPTKYIVYRAKLRVCDLDHIKQLLRFGTEKHFDSETGRHVAVGTHKRYG